MRRRRSWSTFQTSHSSEGTWRITSLRPHTSSSGLVAVFSVASVMVMFVLGCASMNGDPMSFEEPILQIRRQIEEVSAADGEPSRLAELEEKLTKVANEIYANLTPWQKTLVARHSQRPNTLDFIGALFEEWIEVHGARTFADDAAIVAGFARFNGQACAVDLDPF